MLLNEQEDGGGKTTARKIKVSCLHGDNSHISLVKCGLKYLNSLL